MDPPNEDWIMCDMCKLWSHESYCEDENASEDYICDFYRKKY